MRKPLIVLGPRQVGKTFVIKQFAQNEASNHVYINLAQSKDLRDIFNHDLNPLVIFEKILLLIDKISNIKDINLWVIDEIQENPNALNFLKFLNESDLENNVIVTGSWIDAAIAKNGSGYPVGQVELINMHPVSIEEFIYNLHGKKMINYIKKSFNEKKQISNVIHNKLMSLYSKYLFIGDMPDVVDLYLENKENIHNGNISNSIEALRVGYVIWPNIQQR